MQSPYLHFTSLTHKTANLSCDKSQYMPLRGCSLSRGEKGKPHTTLIAPQEMPVVAGINAREMDFTLSASCPVLCDFLEPFRRFDPNHTARTAFQCPSCSQPPS